MVLRIIFDDRGYAVVMESGDNVKSVLAAEIPGEPCAGFFVYDDTASD